MDFHRFSIAFSIITELAALSQDFVPHTTIPAPRMLERRLQSGSDPLLPQAEDGRWDRLPSFLHDVVTCNINYTAYGSK